MELAPYGNFTQLILKGKLFNDEKLVRTYFHQLVDALDYLKSRGIGHLDIRPENMVLDNNFNMKLIDFDMSCQFTDEEFISRGCTNFRAPEMLSKGESIFPTEADIYSAGVVLFFMKTGDLPYIEDLQYNDEDMMHLATSGDEIFWTVHDKFRDEDEEQFEDFKILFESMIRK
eukprot:CAMPEP_0114584372 /NCGR_PEP_ID=MMETSP0125-20121206/8070_1 /TAXON_ID=485358 ORGANISM="Aristerostoma sp., Strain ATCC 50986" /NCGR_SAMPLE_ID=MMETSP0125 /ASSEMBLY_ACC=CAM_ASM_000245 /LENGTH=172 /DNA_ID=CAMNT_0001778693 /DNA_START=254 /DNA_END=772 /DNA_ORIENTATION=+